MEEKKYLSRNKGILAVSDLSTSKTVGYLPWVDAGKRNGVAYAASTLDGKGASRNALVEKLSADLKSVQSVMVLPGANESGSIHNSPGSKGGPIKEPSRRLPHKKSASDRASRPHLALRTSTDRL